MSPFHLLFLILLLTLKLQPLLADLGSYEACRNPFRCGRFKAYYPFWGGYRPDFCGHPDLELSCDEHFRPTIFIDDIKYYILSMSNATKTMRITRADYQEGFCGHEFPSTTLISPLLEYFSEFEMITFSYECPPSPPTMKGRFICSYEHGFIKSGAHSPGECESSVTVPVNKSFISLGMENLPLLKQGLKEGFEVKWNVNGLECEDCIKSQGSCGYDGENNQTVCYCLNQRLEMNSTCPNSSQQSSLASGTNHGRTIGLGVGLAAGVVGLALLGVLSFFVIRRRKRKISDRLISKDIETPASSKSTNITATTTTTSTSTSTDYSRSIPSYRSSKAEVGKETSTYFGAQVFNYIELEEATNNFDSAKECGDGGFGTVYYGVLKDGREVAVKRLYEHNFKRVEQFMTEVEILTRLRHPNLVTLYGCTSRHSRELLLVYEYISNGTLADHLHGRKSNSGLLSWSIRLGIAIETADAIAYLHTSDVIHRDVKTNNILLDQNFHVKVADFGLSRLFPNDVTHVSTAPQGTPGYVDPDYYQCYKLTDKSDVYSFGVVLIELISSLPAVDTNRMRYDINLSNMAITRIQNRTLHELIDPGLGFETDNTVRNMITSVAELAFRCLQQDREIRPSMQEVAEVLRGIQDNEKIGKQKAEEVDICNADDEVVLLKNVPPPVSPESSSF